MRLSTTKVFWKGSLFLLAGFILHLYVEWVNSLIRQYAEHIPLATPGRDSASELKMLALNMRETDVLKQDAMIINSKEPNALKLDTLKPNTLERTPQESNALKLDLVKHTALELNPQESNAVKLDAVKHNALELITQKLNAVKLDTVKPSPLELNPQESKAVKLDSVKSNALELNTQESNAVKLDSGKPNVLELNTTKSNAVKPNTWAIDTQEPNKLKPDTTVKPNVLGLNTQEPKSDSLEFNTIEHKIYPDFHDCPIKSLKPFHQQRGDYWILENYIPADKSFRCNESITYTTHGDYMFLDNLQELTSRWQGPVSVSVYSPGRDFNETVSTILYLRNCGNINIRKYVTFHLILNVLHMQEQVPATGELLQRQTDCGQDHPKWVNVTTYKREKKLLYPVNIARNVARLAAQTYFVLPSDIELYPSINFIPEFLKMLQRPDVSNTTKPRVYVFPIFEVKKETITVPETKEKIQAMLKKGDAITFHKSMCSECHTVPMSKEWQNAPVKPGMSVFNIAKREPPFHKWEPIYLGTNKEPLYDERLSWEGKSDKMTQMYVLCVKEYELHVLDNAFLVHRPGIKKYLKNKERDTIASKQSRLIKDKIFPEYKKLFGYRKGCSV